MDAELAPNRSLRNPAFLALMIAIGLILGVYRRRFDYVRA